MNYQENIIKAVIFGILIAMHSPIPYLAKTILSLKRVKPLDCEKCMAFWIFMILSVRNTADLANIELLFSAAISALGAFVLGRLQLKYLGL